MIYKLNPQLRLIKAPVILVVEGEEKSYGSGEELKTLTFKKNYIIDSIGARESSVAVTLKVNKQIHSITWAREEAVSCT